MGNEVKAPFGSFGFKVKVSLDNGESIGCFQEVSGLGASVNVEDVAEGGCNNHVHRIIKGVSYSNIQLKRGLCNASMYEWIQSFKRSGVIKRLSGTISILGDSLDEVMAEYKFSGGIPVKWDGPQLNVSSDAFATESLEIAPESLEVKILNGKKDTSI